MKHFGRITASLLLALGALSITSAARAQPVTVRVDTPEFGIRIGDWGHRHHSGHVIVAPPAVVVPPPVVYSPHAYGHRHHKYWRKHRKYHQAHFEHRTRSREHGHRHERHARGHYKQKNHHRRDGRHIDHVRIHPH